MVVDTGEAVTLRLCPPRRGLSWEWTRSLRNVKPAANSLRLKVGNELVRIHMAHKTSRESTGKQERENVVI